MPHTPYATFRRKPSRLALMGIRLAEGEGGATPGPAQGAEPKPAPPKEDQTDWKAEARKWEDRAKANAAAAKDGAAAQKRLAELEDANKTETQRQADRTAQLERENAELKATALRAEVAAEKGVPVTLLTGTTREEVEAAAKAALDWLDSKKPAEQKQDTGWKQYLKSNPSGARDGETITPGLGSLRAGYAQLSQKG